MVRDAHNRKMSKSLGNVIDPLHCIEGLICFKNFVFYENKLIFIYLIGISLEELHETLKSGNLGESEVF